MGARKRKKVSCREGETRRDGEVSSAKKDPLKKKPRGREPRKEGDQKNATVIEVAKSARRLCRSGRTYGREVIQRSAHRLEPPQVKKNKNQQNELLQLMMGSPYGYWVIPLARGRARAKKVEEFERREKAKGTPANSRNHVVEKKKVCLR